MPSALLFMSIFLLISTEERPSSCAVVHLIAHSGDVLFAGSIGRTDLPTGSAQDMKKTLKDRILTLPDELNVLPGHGGQTTIGTERVRNPYLQSDYLDQMGR